MIIETSRFGPLEVDGDRLITFERGILGFPDEQRYALIQTGEQSAFYWMQAVDREDLAFVVCDPRMFVPDYRVPVKTDDLAMIGVDDPDQAQVFIIVNKIDDVLTGNLQGPVVINVRTRAGRQLVLSDRKFSTRHPLIRLPKEKAMSRTA
ncbi:MAG: flagellar assembly protein FliW [Phycisphaerales bacterium]|nr:flagellar assembly protein FliW [Phycisphaerales bacterium]